VQAKRFVEIEFDVPSALWAAFCGILGGDGRFAHDAAPPCLREALVRPATLGFLHPHHQESARANHSDDRLVERRQRPLGLARDDEASE